jgi:hypothetical protein
MRVSDRERNQFRRFTAAIAAGNLRDETPDLFQEKEKLARRKSHLILVIQRKARQLKIAAPAGLESKTESELESIRLGLSKQIAARRAAETQEAAA